MAGQHARLSPSGSDGWGNCPGKPRAEAAVAVRLKAEGVKPPMASPAARRGSAGHALITMELEDVCKAREYLGKEITYDESGEEPPWLVDEALVAAAETCVRVVRERIADYEKQGYTVEMKVEQRVDPGSRFTTPRDDCWGSADVILLVFKHDCLHLIEIIDHKLGTGIYVPATSTQACLYGLGAIAEHAALSPVLWPEGGLRTTIIQPSHHRSDPDNPVVSRDWTLLDMQEFRDHISTCAAQTDLPDAPRIPGEKQCQFCDDRADCPALREHSLREASHVFHNLAAEEYNTLVDDGTVLTEEPYLEDPDVLDPATKGRILAAMPLIRSWLNAVEESARQQALRGTRIPGRKLVRGRSSRKYTDEDEVQALLSRAVRTKEHGGKKLRKEDYLTEKVLSPAQAEKRIKPVISTKMWNKIQAFISKSFGEPVLVEESDPREEYVTDTTSIFEAVAPANAPLPEAPAETPTDAASAAFVHNPQGFSALD